MARYHQAGTRGKLLTSALNLHERGKEGVALGLVRTVVRGLDESIPCPHSAPTHTALADVSFLPNSSQSRSQSRKEPEEYSPEMMAPGPHLSGQRTVGVCHVCSREISAYLFFRFSISFTLSSCFYFLERERDMAK